MVIRWTVALAVLIAVCSAWEPRMHLGRAKYGMKHSMKAKEELLKPVHTSNLASNNVGATESHFSQKLDHFNDTEQRTWTQRYFSNMAFTKGGDISVAFLNMGGEGPEYISFVQNEQFPWIQWAKEFSAAVFSLEHRFYGESYPLPDQSTANLKYLSSRQGLADAAYFIQAMKNQTQGLKNARWIVFGGSYSGALSLWMRELYPDLVAGSVGSSAPVQATFDFYKYLEKVQFSLGYPYAGGSAACVQNVKTAFNKIIELMNTEPGRAQLSDIFTLAPHFDQLPTIGYNDIQNYFSTMYGNFQGAVQYSGEGYGAGIPWVCQQMQATSVNNPLAGIQAVNKYFNTDEDGKFYGTPNNYSDMIAYLKVDTWTSSTINKFDSGARSWTWQTCTEFGYFQTTDVKEDLIFGPVTAVNLFSNMCRDVFGDQFTSDYIEAKVDATNKFYGGADGYRGTNVVMPNGNVDPWSMLGKLNATDPTVVPYLIDGTAHCADMNPVKNDGTDKPGLLVVHKLIESNIDLWIRGPASNRTVTNTTTWQRPPVATILATRSKRSVGDVILTKNVKNVAEQAKEEKYRRFQKMHLGRPPHGLLPAPEMPDGATTDNLVTGFFIQPVDHFDKQNPNTFQQKFYKNTQWARPGGPNFIMIGGEGPESSAWAVNGNYTWLVNAQQFGATVYILEHRYYGDSVIGQNGKNQNMQYLSSLQMLYDVANFITWENYNTGNTAQWVVFGGSYSGAMALWMRQIFPDLVVGAVGSSGPIQAKIDFYEYLQVVEASIRSYDNNCADNIGKAFTDMQQKMLTPNGRQQLNDLFTLSPQLNLQNPSEIDKQYFFQNMYGNFQGAVQYSGDNTRQYATSYGIPFMCSFMVNNTNLPINNVVAFNKAMTEFYTGAPFKSTDNDYYGFVDYLQSGVDPSSKYWTWQTCTEFGYFQSSDLGNNIFGSPTPVNMFTQMCRDVFGAAYTGQNVEDMVKYTNFKYGGRDGYKGTNVVIPNGSIDPWHALGKYQGPTNDPSAVIVYINGTAHCADMYPARPDDLPSLTAARVVIQQNIATWINGGSPGQPTASPVTVPPNTETTTRGSTTLTASVALVASLLLLH